MTLTTGEPKLLAGTTGNDVCPLCAADERIPSSNKSQQQTTKSNKIRTAVHLRKGDSHESQNRIRSFYCCFFHSDLYRDAYGANIAVLAGNVAVLSNHGRTIYPGNPFCYKKNHYGGMEKIYTKGLMRGESTEEGRRKREGGRSYFLILNFSFLFFFLLG